MKNSHIQWTHHTFNPWRGCTKVSPGCSHCYAKTMSARNPAQLGVWGPQGTRVVASDSMWQEPVKWNTAAEQAGVRHRVFCASLADVFEARHTMPEECWKPIEDARLRLLELIRTTPHLDWLLLTKRPRHILPHLNVAMMQAAIVQMGELEQWLQDWVYDGKAPSNVWLGTSVEDQWAAEERIPTLLSVPAKVRFLSCEPLLGPVELPLWRCLNCHKACKVVLVNNDKDYGCSVCKHLVSTIGYNNKPGRPLQQAGIDWVICGGESGPQSRPFDIAWARDLRRQCKDAGVPFFMKQLGQRPRGDDEFGHAQHYAYFLQDGNDKGGNFDNWPSCIDDLKVREFPA